MNYTAGTLTNLGRPRCTLQSALSLGILTLRRLARAHCGRLGEASTHSSDAFEPPSKRTEGSQKQTHLGLELLGCISVRFVIYSQKQEGSVMRKRSGSAHRNSWHHRYRSYHHQVTQLIINKPIHSLSIYISKKKTTLQIPVPPLIILPVCFKVFSVFSLGLVNFLKLLAIIDWTLSVYSVCFYRSSGMDLRYYDSAFDANSTVSITYSGLVVVALWMVIMF